MKIPGTVNTGVVLDENVAKIFQIIKTYHPKLYWYDSDRYYRPYDIKFEDRDRNGNINRNRNLRFRSKNKIHPDEKNNEEYDSFTNTKDGLIGFLKRLFNKRILPLPTQDGPKVTLLFNSDSNMNPLDNSKIKQINNALYVANEDKNMQTLLTLDRRTNDYTYKFNIHPFIDIKFNNGDIVDIVYEYDNADKYVWVENYEKTEIFIYKAPKKEFLDARIKQIVEKINVNIDELIKELEEEKEEFEEEKEAFEEEKKAFEDGKANPEKRKIQIKILMNFFPILFMVGDSDFENVFMNLDNSTRIKFHPILCINDVNNITPILQGSHGLCWLCSVCNAIYKNKESLILDDYVTAGVKGLIDDLFQHFCILEFIKKFEFYVFGDNKTKFMTMYGGDSVYYIRRILKLIGNFKIGKETNSEYLPIISKNRHAVAVYDGKVYDSNFIHAFDVGTFGVDVDMYYGKEGDSSGSSNRFEVLKKDGGMCNISLVYVGDLSAFKISQMGGFKVNKKNIRYLKDLYLCNDNRLRKAFRIKGYGNMIFVRSKNDVVRAVSIPKQG